MGTYTTNYQLYMPTVGETGWGTLVNGNYQTIDTTMKGLSNRITAVENEVNGNLSCTSVTTSGKVTANGGVTSTTGTFSGAITAAKFNGRIIKTGTITITPTNTDWFVLPTHQYYQASTVYHDSIATVLPPVPNVTYSGSIRIHNTHTSQYGIYVYNGMSSMALNFVVASGYSDYEFSNISCLTLSANNTDKLYICTFTMS